MGAASFVLIAAALTSAADAAAAAGYYTDASGAAVLCPPCYFCSAGSTAPTPCAALTASGAGAAACTRLVDDTKALSESVGPNPVAPEVCSALRLTRIVVAPVETFNFDAAPDAQSVVITALVLGLVAVGVWLCSLWTRRPSPAMALLFRACACVDVYRRPYYIVNDDAASYNNDKPPADAAEAAAEKAVASLEAAEAAESVEAVGTAKAAETATAPSSAAAATALGKAASLSPSTRVATAASPSGGGVETCALRVIPTASSRPSPPLPPPRLPRRVPVVFVQTALGGACSLLAIITFLALAALLLLRYARWNTLVTSSLAVLSMEANEAAVELPWATAPKSSLLMGTSGVQLRVYAQGGLGSCASPIGFKVVGLLRGAWVSTSVDACSPGLGGVARSVLVWSCAECVFDDVLASLSFSLPPACQALYLEISAIDAGGSVMTLVFDRLLSKATPAGGFLAEIDWEVRPTLSLETDKTRNPWVTKGGYQLSRGTEAVRLVPLAAAPPYTLLTPMNITLAFKLEGFYSNTVLTPIATPLTLLASIIGLVGVIGGFRGVFVASEAVVKQLLRRAHVQDLDGWLIPGEARTQRDAASPEDTASSPEEGKAGGSRAAVPRAALLPSCRGV